ncbi:MAG: DUF6537 domain-containing protein [Planctomycetota bacterium]
MTIASATSKTKSAVVSRSIPPSGGTTMPADDGQASVPLPKTDPRFLQEQGVNVFTGNELLIKGCLETPGGVHLLGGYPGSPVAGFFDAAQSIGPLLKHKGIRAFQSANEALSVASLNGSQMAACRGIVAMKSVGVHVASDAMALGNLGGPHPEGGAIVICGDDPWCDSTQVPADSRFLCEHLRMAIVEPGSGQELKDWIALSFELSRAAGLYVGYVVTTNQVDGGGSVDVKPNHWPAVNTNQRMALESQKIDLDRVLLPPRTWQQELTMPERHERACKVARELGLNKIIPAKAAGHAPIGFVTTGMSDTYLRHVLRDLGLTGRFPVLHLGMCYPADAKLLAEFGQQCEHMVVLEERRSFVEKNLRDAVQRELPTEQAVDLTRRLFGKKFPGNKAGIPETRGLNPSLLLQLLAPMLKEAAPDAMEKIEAKLAIMREVSRRKLEVLGAATAAVTTNEKIDAEPKLPARTPTFCPGCPHRDSSALLLEVRKLLSDADYMRRNHKRGPIDLIAHGDTGCYTMLMFPPTEQLMHNYSGMGLGGGTGSGIDAFLDPEKNKQIVFMGDGTFFHSGQVAIANAVAARQDLTFIILQNGTTAMTGHQGHAATENDLLGDPFPMQEIENIVRGVQGATVFRADPADRELWKTKLEQTILADGVKVLIADKECGITLHRRKKREEQKTAEKFGFVPTKTHMNITPEVCEHCLECTKATACPGLKPVDTDYGRKIDTDLTWCVNDGACERVRVTNEIAESVKPCPSFEEVKIIRGGKAKKLEFDVTNLPDPTPRLGNDEDWRCHLTGVGGMGVGTVAAVLVTAGHFAGRRVVFNEKKGLAIRNGGVFAQLCWLGRSNDTFDPATAPTGLIPYGHADLLLGIDILEAARATDPRESYRIAHKQRTAAVLNTHKQATVSGLLGQEDFDPDELAGRISERCDASRAYARNLSDLCQTHLGSSQYVNVLAVGVAFQRGEIPTTADVLEKAIGTFGKRDRERNLLAFRMGRRLALDPGFLAEEPAKTWENLLREKLDLLNRTGRKKTAGVFETLCGHAVKVMPNLSDEGMYDLLIRVYDTLSWGGPQYAKRYLDAVRGVYRRDSADQKYEAAHAAVWSVAKVMLIKDEPWVAHLLSRPEKYERDKKKYAIDEANGDRIEYTHHNSPEVPIGPWKLRLNFKTKPWMLKLAAKGRLVRKLPGWHGRETGFRDFFLRQLPKLDLTTTEGYDRALHVLRAPQEVTGYREIRYPKQERARREIERLVSA